MKHILLNDYHAENAKMIEFADFNMPLYYTSIIKEHLSVRDRVGLFDITHMGRAVISGRDSHEYANYLTVNDVNRLTVGRAHYSLFCNKEGGIVDDLMVYNISDEDILLVYNAANREKDIEWINKHRHGFDVSIKDISNSSIMFALQGPLYQEVLSDMFYIEDARFRVTNINFKGYDGWIATTGYTGERGVEIVLITTEYEVALDLWLTLLRKVRDLGGLPCGLGARDSLRLEAGYCLYGNDIDENTNPYEANLGWVVKMDQDRFIGKNRLAEVKDEIQKIRTGLVIERGLVRAGDFIYDDDIKIGYVTSGTYSPILNRGIAMGYIDIERDVDGMKVTIRSKDGRLRKGHIKSFPLYDSDRYGWNRKNYPSV